MTPRSEPTKKSRRQYNRGVVYAGAVGAKMKARDFRTRRGPVKKVTVKLEGGPLDGVRVRLDAFAQNITLPITLKGQTGRYRGNPAVWEAA